MTPRQVHGMTDSEPALSIDPKQVTCGFCMFPVELGNPPIPMVHEALETNQKVFWSKVRKHNPGLTLHLFGTRNPANSVTAIPTALEKVGAGAGCSIVIGQLKMGPHDIYVGFCYPDENPRVIIAKSNRVAPGRAVNTTQAAGGTVPALEDNRALPGSAASTTSSSEKKWWKFW